MSTTSEPLRALLDRAHEQHADKPQAFAEALAARARFLGADAEGAEAIRLAEHVMVGHLADAGALQAFIDAVPAALAQAELTLPCLQSAKRCIALMRGDAAADAPPRLRWRSLHNVALGFALTGRAHEAQQWLVLDEHEALAHPEAPARQAYAAAANNIAVGLRTGARGDATSDALMITAAEIARRAWAAAGTWLHVERAEYQLAMCHAVLGQGPQALHHAQLCLGLCSAQGADALEHFFAHEACLHAHRAAGDLAAARTHREQMAAWLPQVADENLRDWCAKTLENTPA
jgi:hypothetical protein